MTWFHWLLVAMFGLGALITIGSIDVPRKPITKGDAILIVLIKALLIWGVLAYA